MATFNYTVDTNPMAQTIGSVSNHVKATTTAVVAMQTAVIMAEEKAADFVCENVNKGFFALLRSQNSQKIAEALSKVDSFLMQLNQQTKQLLAIKGRMERDYNRISVRYMKIFNGLNINLKQRVIELDKPVMNFALREVEKISNRNRQLTATVPVSQMESISISQKIVASHVKNRGFKAVGAMTKFLSDIYEQKKLNSRIMLSSVSYFENSTISLPVVITEYNFDKYNNKNVEINIQPIGLSKQTQDTIKNVVMSNVDNMKWQNEAKINREIRSEFNTILAKANISSRVKDMANKLFLANNYQTVNI